MEGLEDFRFAVEGIGLVRVMQNISSSKESRQKAKKRVFWRDDKPQNNLSEQLFRLTI